MINKTLILMLLTLLILANAIPQNIKKKYFNDSLSFLNIKDDSIKINSIKVNKKNMFYLNSVEEDFSIGLLEGITKEKQIVYQFELTNLEKPFYLAFEIYYFFNYCSAYNAKIKMDSIYANLYKYPSCLWDGFPQFYFVCENKFLTIDSDSRYALQLLIKLVEKNIKKEQFSIYI